MSSLRVTFEIVQMYTSFFTAEVCIYNQNLIPALHEVMLGNTFVSGSPIEIGPYASLIVMSM